MSYDVFLKDPETGKPLQSAEEHDISGGTYCVGGTRSLALNVTYNYSPHFCRVLHEKSLRGLYGMTGANSIPLLESAISKLGDDVSDDYWEPTEGNAKRALEGLLSLARMAPSGVWDGD